jgi:hypothetical protein
MNFFLPDQPAIVGVLPHWQPRAGCAPRIHDFFIGSVFIVDPLEKIQDQGFDYCVGHAIILLSFMLFMVIERFKNGDPRPIGARFRQSGRMLPAGVTYHASWVDPAEGRCFQVMEAPDEKALNQWINNWSDLVGFEVVAVLTSADFWANAQ